MSRSNVMNEVWEERLRQIGTEGFDIEHDDEHDSGELARAGACYAINAAGMSLVDNAEPEEYAEMSSMPLMWPWGQKWWKPKNPRRDLVRAAALIIAEIEKLDRTETLRTTQKEG